MSDPQRLDGTRILLVEDEENVRRTLTTLLSMEGADVTSTGSGRHALELAANGRFDLLLTDLDLPDVPGAAIIRQVLAEPNPGRVIVLTGSGQADLSRARQAGAEIVLLKPVEWSTLVAQVRAAVRPGDVVRTTSQVA